MTLKSTIPIVLGLSLFGYSFVFASDETNREIVRTYANFYLHQRDYAAGWSVLTEHLKTDSKDAAAWNILGLIYLEASRPKEAAQAFYQAADLATEETRGIYLYNYADALTRSNDVEKARTVLASASQEDLVAASAKNALENIKPNQPLPPLELSSPSVWKGSIAIAGGFDTNVLLSSDATLASTTPSDAASPVISTIAQVQNTSPYGARALETKASTAFSYYSKEAAREFNSLASSLTVDLMEVPSADLSVIHNFGNKFDLSYLNDNGFRFFNWADSLKWQMFIHHSARSRTEFEIPVGYQKYAVEDGDDPADDRSGVILTPSLVYRLISGAGSFSLGLRYEKLFASGDNYKSDAFAVPLSWSHSLPWRMIAAVNVEGSAIAYPSSSTSRRDTVFKAGVSLGRNIGKSMTGLLDYSFRRSMSNVESAKYTKHAVLLMVSYEFL